MDASDLLACPEGAGWLVLSGGNSAAGIVRASVLTRSGPGPIAYLTTSGDPSNAQSALEDMESLGAPSGYFVDTTREDDETIAELLAEASVIVLEDEPSVSALVANLQEVIDDVLSDAHENGALLLAEGGSAAAFGSWLIEDGELLPALAWLEGTLITTGADIEAELSTASELHVHISNESALALGPNGALELWGEGDVRITLGSEYFS